MIEIILNNTPERFDVDQISVSGLLAVKNFTFRMLVIKINGVFVPKDQYHTAMIHSGDEVMVLHLISGG